LAKDDRSLYVFNTLLSRFEERVYEKNAESCELARAYLESAHLVLIHEIGQNAECEKRMATATRMIVNKMIVQTDILLNEVISGAGLEKIIGFNDKARTHKMSLIGTYLENVGSWIIKEKEVRGLPEPESKNFEKIQEKTLRVVELLG
jgi:hypothetical protein